MTDNNKYTTSDLIVSAIDQKPFDFEAAFDNLIVGKLQSAIEAKKVEIAQQMYNYDPETEQEYESEE